MPLTIPQLLRTCIAIAPLLALLSTAGARADDGRDPVAAEALFREGRRALEAGDPATACPKFHESMRLDPSPGALLNLASCEERLGRLADAWEHFRRAVETLPADDARVDVARSRVADLERRLPKLVVDAAAALPAGTRVLRDGVALGAATLGVALPVNPGDCVVVVRAPGHADATFRVRMEPGAEEHLAVAIGAPLPDRARAPDGGGAHARRTVGLVVVGVGLAGLAVGAVSGIGALGEAGTVEDRKHCDAALRCDAAGVAAARRGSTLATVSTVGLVAGVAGVSAGVALVLTSGGGAAVATTTLALGARVPGAMALGLTRSF